MVLVSVVCCAWSQLFLSLFIFFPLLIITFFFWFLEFSLSRSNYIMVGVSMCFSIYLFSIHLFIFLPVYLSTYNIKFLCFTFYLYHFSLWRFCHRSSCFFLSGNYRQTFVVSCLSDLVRRCLLSCIFTFCAKQFFS